MNVNDFTADKIEGDRLVAIFEKQRALMEKYEEIEAQNGLLQTPDIPVDIHDRKGQARLKDFAWRMTEELGEALEALVIHLDVNDHYDEEVADALHFLTEFTILAGMSPEQVVSDINNPGNDLLEQLYYYVEFGGTKTDRNYDSLVYRTGRVVEAMALTCNTLKNKPWKQSHMLTDIKKFQNNLRKVWIEFIRLCVVANISPERITDLYFRKNKVNRFRQESKY